MQIMTIKWKTELKNKKLKTFFVKIMLLDITIMKTVLISGKVYLNSSNDFLGH